jgi:hypothetical protein
VAFVIMVAHAPSQAPAGPQEPIEFQSGPITRIAVMISDLDAEDTGRAVLDGESGQIVVCSSSEFPRQIRGGEVLVYHSERWGGWRLLSTDIGMLSPEFRTK